ncbi:hypothetical protein ACTFIZ_007299 [Dictyostelium cf. discoideum]
MGIFKEIDKTKERIENPIKQQSNVNNDNYKLLRQSNRTTIKVVKGFLYLSLLGEGIKTYKGNNLLNTLVSTLGAGFIIGSLTLVNKLSSGEEMIQLTDIKNDNEQEIKKQVVENEEKKENEIQDDLDTDSEEYSSEEYSSDEEEDQDDNHIDCTNKIVGFSMFKLYKFLPYGVVGALASNCLASITMGALYGVSVPLEWNLGYYKEIGNHICRLCIENFIFFFATDIFFKTKYLIFKEKEKKNK